MEQKGFTFMQDLYNLDLDQDLQSFYKVFNNESSKKTLEEQYKLNDLRNKSM